MRYYLISCSEDGDLRVDEYDKQELEHELNTILEEGCGEPEFVEKIPDSDPNYWGGKMVCVKGEVVVPAAERIVTQYKVPE